MKFKHSSNFKNAYLEISKKYFEPFHTINPRYTDMHTYYIQMLGYTYKISNGSK